MISLVGGELYQWDTGRTIVIQPETDIVVHEVHFTHKKMDFAYVVNTYTEDGVTYCSIPNIILQQGQSIICYEVCKNDDGEETVLSTTFKVIKRNKPEDYIYTEIELKSLDDLLIRIEELEHKSSNVLKSDWSESDETSLAFIQNKPFGYVTGTTTICLREDTLTDVEIESGGAANLSNKYSFWDSGLHHSELNGTTCTISCNDKVYELQQTNDYSTWQNEDETIKVAADAGWYGLDILSLYLNTDEFISKTIPELTISWNKEENVYAVIPKEYMPEDYINFLIDAKIGVIENGSY